MAYLQHLVEEHATSAGAAAPTLDQGLAALSTAAAEEVRDFWARASGAEPGALLWSFQRGVARLLGMAAELEQAFGAIERSRLRAALDPMRALLSRGTLLRRIQEWPRGYPGDFQTIETMLDGHVSVPEDPVAGLVDAVALSSPITLQHGFKIHRQREEVLAASRAHGGRANILVIACGGARDLNGIRAHLVSSQDRVVLNDIDEDALALASSRLSGMGDRLQVVHGNALMKRRALAALGPFDLVVAGGLYDYLDERAAKTLTRMISAKLLRPGGRFFFTNIRRAHPFRLMMEGMVNWELIERDEPELEDIAASAGLGEVRVDLDATGLAYLVAAQRRGEGA